MFIDKKYINENLISSIKYVVDENNFTKRIVEYNDKTFRIGINQIEVLASDGERKHALSAPTYNDEQDTEDERKHREFYQMIKHLESIATYTNSSGRITVYITMDNTDTFEFDILKWKIYYEYDGKEVIEVINNPREFPEDVGIEYVYDYIHNKKERVTI